MRIFIDCTSTYSSGMNTGIERVVRNIAMHSASSGSSMGVSCQSVILVGGRYTHLATIAYDSEKKREIALRAAANKGYSLFVGGLARLLPRAWQCFLTGSKHEPSLARFIVLLLARLQGISRKVRHSIVNPSDAHATVQFQQGDILLLADSVWNYSPWAAVQEAKSAGAHVAAIVYDIIPATHHQFFAPISQKKFSSALPFLFQHADAYLCISTYTKTQLHAYYAAQPYTKTLAPKQFYCFTLGVELDTLDYARQVRTKIRAVFRTGRSVYLAVGTLEPRKNHAYLLQVFQKLWDAGSNAVLLIVGRVGWMCDAVLDAIQCHPKLGQQLFFMDDVNDTELNYCYTHARALLFPSVMEGFGLPIIEALHKRLPVFASDIPVFREVGGEYVVYFDHAAPTTLVEFLQEYEATGIYAARSPADFNWPDWSESTTELLTQLIAMYPVKITA